MGTDWDFYKYCIYSNWLYGVAATGTFVKNPNAAWTLVSATGVPSGWTIEMDESITLK